ncbi:cholecystokinin receptor type A-like isoform X2 [Episyrphus balteatus]|uniref:cholecystokinin receptor type A-like isoform X2 n=1 Tax=Episyrphus balteatus TaxID=286459 RepID=UPI0024864907|nr:cholecystokinin receptor type A-like isoform X2 [Episyrphus balteatus]
MSVQFKNTTLSLSELFNYHKNNPDNSLSALIIKSNNNGSDTSGMKASWLSGGEIQIPCYTIILLLSVVGNLLVISTLVQNRRMRTITNVFLLNLAISDILLGVLCMPVTLVGTLLRHFIFGEFLCKLIPFLQATSVAVSSWTLVAISCERYYAICHPLRSRTWQTLSHAYKIIALIWIGSFFCMSPIAALSQLIPTSKGLRKCREYWPEDGIIYERTYNILLDLILLVIPLFVLCAAYILITRTLYTSIKNENLLKNSIGVSYQQQSDGHDKINHYDAVQRNKIYPDSRSINLLQHQSTDQWKEVNLKEQPASLFMKKEQSILRKSNLAKNLENKRRVVKMLFVLVLEFFICWTPLYVINTITLFNPTVIYQNVGYTTISFFQLLAYSSSCCNPITYCFMNAGFRKAFLHTFIGIHGAGKCWRSSSKTIDLALESPKIYLKH